jgi:hypothetical protein
MCVLKLVVTAVILHQPIVKTINVKEKANVTYARQDMFLMSMAQLQLPTLALNVIQTASFATKQDPESVTLLDVILDMFTTLLIKLVLNVIHLVTSAQQMARVNVIQDSASKDTSSIHLQNLAKGVSRRISV